MCNANWPEIKQALLPGQNAVDRPDLTVRVFNMYRSSLMDEIIRDGKVRFGPVLRGIFSNPEPDHRSGSGFVANLGPDHWFGPKRSGSGSQGV